MISSKSVRDYALVFYAQAPIMAATVAQQAAIIEDLQAEIEEQCRINSMGGERELALMAKVEQLTSDRDKAEKMHAKVASENLQQREALNLAREAIARIETHTARDFDSRNSALTAIDNVMKGEGV